MAARLPEILARAARASAAVPVLLAIGGAGEAAAQDKAASGLALELNRLEQVEAGCRLAFVAQNGLAGDLENVSLEIVIFDEQGQVQRLTVFDFGALPAGRPRVRQFELPQTQCGSVGRILVNGVSQCTGKGIAPGACEAGLKLENRTKTEFRG